MKGKKGLWLGLGATHSVALLSILSPKARAGAAMHMYVMYLAVVGSTLALNIEFIAIALLR